MLSEKVLNIKLTKRTMKTILTTHHELTFNSEINDISGFKRKTYLAGTHLSEKPTSKSKIHLTFKV